MKYLFISLLLLATCVSTLRANNRQYPYPNPEDESSKWVTYRINNGPCAPQTKKNKIDRRTGAAIPKVTQSENIIEQHILWRHGFKGFYAVVS